MAHLEFTAYVLSSERDIYVAGGVNIQWLVWSLGLGHSFLND